MSNIELEGNRLSVEVEAESGINYSISVIGCNKEDIETKVIETISGPAASFTLDENINFVRIKVVSTKLHPNPIEDLIFEMAWTQPVTFAKE